MSRFVKALLLSGLLSLVLGSAVAAGIGLKHVLSYTIPDLTGGIQQLVIKDIDGDSAPEIAGSDSLFLFLYSPRYSHMYMKTPLDTNYDSHMIVVGDVNRDSITDVVVGYRDGGSRLDVVLYDGALNYTEAARVEYPISAPDPRSPWAPRPADLAVVDLDGDGVDQLAVSYDSSYIGQWQSVTRGVTHFYRSFPSELDYSQPKQLFGFFEVPLEFPGIRHWVHDVRVNITDMPGVNVSSRQESLLTIRPDGTTENLLTLTNPFPCDGYEWMDNSSLFETRASFCYGDSTLGIIGLEKYELRCFIPNDLWRVWSPKAMYLTFYTVKPNSEPIQQWTKLNVARLSTITYHADYPYSFFAYIEGYLIRQSIVDGSYLEIAYVGDIHRPFWIDESLFGEPLLVEIDYQTINLYTIDVNTDVDGEEANNLPATIALSDPYPNPFNPTVRVTLSMPARASATVEVFNIVGQRVDILHDGNISAGETVFEWDGSDYASGLYLFRASSGENVTTVKGVLLK